MPAPSPKWIEQRLNRSLAQLREGRLFKAQRTVDEVLERVPEQVDALRLAGDVARADGRLERALELYVAAARQEPSHLKTLDAITNVAAALDLTGKAIQALELAVIADPSDGARQRRLGGGYFLAGKLHDALGHARLATMLSPDDVLAHELQGTCLIHLDDTVAALQALRRAVELGPDDASVLVNTAIALDDLGQTDEARDLRVRASELAPAEPYVAFNTKDLSVASADDPRLEALEQRLEDPMLAVEDRVLGGLALAKLWDDAGDTGRAARHLRSANDLRHAQLERRGTAYDARSTTAGSEAVRGGFSAQVLGRARELPASPVPIVLVGLPRAGKTLLEARLCEDPSLVALGERPVHRELQAAVKKHTGAEVPGRLEQLSDADLREVADTLLASLRQVPGATDATGLVTTSPANLTAAGLYALVDERTVVVHCRRDPRDVLLANYLQWFPNQNPWAYTVDGLVHRCGIVDTLADHWRSLLGARFVTVDYEQLVTEPAAVLAAVRLTAGLPARTSAVPVDHVAQVATSPTAKPDPQAPLHRAHVGMWRRWQPHLPELFDAVEQAGLVDTGTDLAG